MTVTAPKPTPGKWEVWNEPDINYFRGTPEQYLRLYDITTAAIRQVLPHAIVGGPAVTGGGENKNFLRLFLEHCARGPNADTHQIGAPLDFISFHPKGSPKFLPADATTPAHVRMNLSRQLSATDRGFQIIASFPEYRQTPIILSETDPEGCAACQGPQNGYRNGPLYGVSVAEMLVRSAELARLRGVNLAGAVTWAFEFEKQPYFAGFRELATSGPEGLIDKPVLNVFRMFGCLTHLQTAPTISPSPAPPPSPSPSSPPPRSLAAPDIDGIATPQRPLHRHPPLELPRRRPPRPRRRPRPSKSPASPPPSPSTSPSTAWTRPTPTPTPPGSPSAVPRPSPRNNSPRSNPPAASTSIETRTLTPSSQSPHRLSRSPPNPPPPGRHPLSAHLVTASKIALGQTP